jgi:hypothetical protein
LGWRCLEAVEKPPIPASREGQPYQRREGCLDIALRSRFLSHACFWAQALNILQEFKRLHLPRLYHLVCSFLLQGQLCPLHSESQGTQESPPLQPRMSGGGGLEENDEGVNSTMIYCKNFCKCHNVSPVQQYDIKKPKRSRVG